MEEYVNVKVKGTEQRTRYSCTKVNALWFRGGKLVSPMTMEASMHISYYLQCIRLTQHQTAYIHITSSLQPAECK